MAFLVANVAAWLKRQKTTTTNCVVVLPIVFAHEPIAERGYR
jgi:hypothetical protein